MGKKLEHSTTLDDAQKHHDDGDYEKDVDESTDRVTGHQA